MPGSVTVSLVSCGRRRRQTILRLIVGRTVNELPVHATRAFLCVTIQSIVPSSCTTAKEVMEDLVATSAVRGLVDEIWQGQHLPPAQT